MKNKKSIAMAMAAVSTLGAVAPAFANEVTSRALTDLTVDYRLANGEVLVNSGAVLVGRDALYNDNFTPNDKSDDTFKKDYKNAQILLTKNTKDAVDTNDLFVLVEKATDKSDVSMEKAQLDAMIAEIKDAKEEGATVTVGELRKANIKKNAAGLDIFEDSQIIVTVTPKNGTAANAKQYTFNGVPGIEEETPAEVNPFEGLFVANEVTATANVTVANKAQMTNTEKDEYYKLNKFKLVAEKNKANFDFEKEQDETNKLNLLVKVYKKGADKTDSTNLKFTMTIANYATLEKELVMSISEGTDFNGHWAKEQIEEAMLLGQVDAVSKFNPQDSITRAQFAKIVCTVFNVNMNNAAQGEPFNDVAKDAWYYDYVSALYNTKVGNTSVVEGDGENFRPDDKISRQEVAVILAKMTSNTNKETTATDINGKVVEKVQKTIFKDTKDIASWADESVHYLSETEYATGKAIAQGTNGYFNPTKEITRAESLVMVQRAAIAKANNVQP